MSERPDGTAWRTAACALALLVAACGTADDPTVQPPDEDEIVAPEESDADEEVDMDEFTGTLGGDAQLEGGCTWLDADDGTRYEIVWPEGLSAETDPVRLVDTDGSEVAAEGSQLSVRGSVAEDMMSICQVGPIVEAEEVDVHD